MPGVPVTDRTIAHEFRLRDVYAEAQASPLFTRKVPNAQVTIDFMFASNDLSNLGVVRPMNAKERFAALKTSMPSRAHPSDHVPLAAVFR